MSLNDIVNYVRTTPGNTNPSVVRSMIEGQIGEYVEEASNQALQKLGVKEESAKIIARFDLTATDGMTMYQELNTSIRLVAGKTYIVETDTGTYTDVCESMYDGACFYVGNTAIVGGADNDKTYGVLVLYEDDTWIVRAIDAACGSRMTISTPETITPIDQKYLPSGGLPFVELETVPSFKEGQPTALSKSDIATINGICTSGIKCFVVSVYVQALKLYMTTVLTAVNGNGFSGFVGILPLITDIVSIVISQDGEDGAWIITTANPN